MNNSLDDDFRMRFNKNLIHYVSSLTIRGTSPDSWIQSVLREIDGQQDMFQSLAESSHYRGQLMEIAITLNGYDEDKVMTYLNEDEYQARSFLRGIVNSERAREGVSGLSKEVAEKIMILLMKSCGHTSWTGDKALLHNAHRLIVKLFVFCDVLPSSMLIKGVGCESHDYETGGGFGDVFRGKYEGNDVALKRLRIIGTAPERVKRLRVFSREILMWQPLKHPRILPLLGLDANCFRGYVCMVSPWMVHGTVQQYMEVNNVSSNLLHRFIRETAEGLQYLHSQNIVHGDLKRQNILIDDGHHIRLTDFGLSVFSDSLTGGLSFTHGQGSTPWMAPELLDPSAFGIDFKRTNETDVYAFACVVVELHSGKTPFKENPSVRVTEMVIANIVLNGGRPPRPSGSGVRHMSDRMWDLVNICWAQQPLGRPRITDVIKRI